MTPLSKQKSLKEKLINIAKSNDIISIKKKPVANMGYNALDAQSVFDAVMPLLRESNILFSTKDICLNHNAITKEAMRNIKGIDTVIKENYIQITITGTAVFTDGDSDAEFETGFFGFAEDKMDKAMPQANTIARKYALAHVFHIYGEADPESKSENLFSIKAYLTVKRDEIEAIAHSVENPTAPKSPHKIFYEKPDELEAMKKIFQENGYIFSQKYNSWGTPRV